MFIEYLNLSGYADLARIRRDLHRQSLQQPPEQALMVFRMCRPEIVAFVARYGMRRVRLLQLHIDMDMTGLLLRVAGEEDIREARLILLDSVRFLEEAIRDVSDRTLPRYLAMCMHRLAVCSMRLGESGEAEKYCIREYEVCRSISKDYSLPLGGQEELALLFQAYRDLDTMFSAHADREKRYLGYQAQARMRRCRLWRLEMTRREELRNLVNQYMKLGAFCLEGDTPELWAMGLEEYGKALALIGKYRKSWPMRRALPEVCLAMGSLWERYGDTRSLLKAKECYVRGLDAAKVYCRDCGRRGENTVVAQNFLRGCYQALERVCGKLPGEKNVEKAAKYRALAESVWL